MPEQAESIVKSAQITQLINECLEGVAKSELGAVKRPPKSHEPNVTEVIDNIAFQTFIVILNNIFPKIMEARMEAKHEMSENM